MPLREVIGEVIDAVLLGLYGLLRQAWAALTHK